jgi:hypothetical protein
MADAVDRGASLQHTWPEMRSELAALTEILVGAATELDPPADTVIHGDMAAGQFVWTGERLVLLDMDTIARSDPAYDVGHFLGQLERRCVLDQSLPWHSRHWLACFRHAYPAAAIGVSWRNVAFYHGATLIRKLYTLARREPDAGPRLAPLLAERARAALESVESVVTGHEALAGHDRRST